MKTKVKNQTSVKYWIFYFILISAWTIACIVNHVN